MLWVIRVYMEFLEQETICQGGTLPCIFEVNKPGIQADRILCLSKFLANSQSWESSIQVERGRLVWEPLARPSLEHAASVWWTGGKVASKRLEAVQEATWSKQVCGRSSSTRRPRVEEASGKEGREEGALWKEGGEA